MADAKRTPGPYVIVDIRPKFSGCPYITFWRPDNAGYAYPLCWAGDYSEADIAADPEEYTHRVDNREDSPLTMFPVLRSVAEKLGIKPAPGMVDGDAGPVLRNTRNIRAALELMRRKPSCRPTEALAGKGGGDG